MGWNPVDLGGPRGVLRGGGALRDLAGFGDLGNGRRGPVGWDPVGCKGLSILEGAREILQGLGDSMGWGYPAGSGDPSSGLWGLMGGGLWGIWGSIGNLVVLGHSRGPSRVWGPWGALRNLVGGASLRVAVLEGPCRVRVQGVQ